MTTTQTGGGNGAAPDGGSGRKLPTRPGWWWRMGDHEPYLEEVDECDLSVMCIDGDDVVDDGSWLAPIPGPAVLAALAEYDSARAIIDSDAPQTADDLGRAATGSRQAIMSLRDALRAERNGAA